MITLKSNEVLTPERMHRNGVYFVNFLTIDYGVTIAKPETEQSLKKANDGFIEMLRVYMHALGYKMSVESIARSANEILKSFKYCRDKSLKALKDIYAIPVDQFRIAIRMYEMCNTTPFDVIYGGGNSLDRYLFNYLALCVKCKDENDEYKKWQTKVKSRSHYR